MARLEQEKLIGSCRSFVDSFIGTCYQRPRAFFSIPRRDVFKQAHEKSPCIVLLYLMR